MSQNSNIEWTGDTWNPIAGCSIVSAGCQHCYAMRMAARLESMGQAIIARSTRVLPPRRVMLPNVVSLPSVSVAAALGTE